LLRPIKKRDGRKILWVTGLIQPAMPSCALHELGSG
jgi:hypothetical protein